MRRNVSFPPIADIIQPIHLAAVDVTNTWAVRLCGGLICLLSIVALVPASLLALGGMMSLGAPDLDWSGKLYGAAIAFAGPLALGFGAMFGWQAVDEGNRRDLVRGALATAVAVVLYVGVWRVGA